VETAAGRDLLLAPKTELAARFFGAGQVLPCRVLKKNESGIEVSCPLGALTIPHDSELDSFINDSPPPKLFIPEDAVFFEATDAAGRKPFNAQFTDSLFEGKNHVLKFLLDSWEDGQYHLEISASPRMNVPESGTALKLWVDQNLLKLVKAAAVG
ncbi:MAG: hypothetical protein LBI04_09980, partial [Treponema sp.]|nr:hypothetical protein [Treponema sp.]